MIDSRLKGALAAISDTLMVELSIVQTGEKLEIRGCEDLHRTPVGDVRPEIVQSQVHEDRDMIIVLVRFAGALGACVMADGEQGQLTFIVLDFSKLPDPTKVRILPTFWLRKSFYERIVPGVKALHSKAFYDKAWVQFQEIGNKWMYTYIKSKNSKIAASGRTATPTDHVPDRYDCDCDMCRTERSYGADAPF